ncbi:MAG: enoyl-CoA hydratase/carnithine racemase [Arenicella sp.]|jgi:enoyl-CoA hydratase/carnithine racemase
MINDRIEFSVENHVAHVTLSRADKMNALDNKMFDAIPMVGEQIRSDPSIRVVVVSGDGGNFCAGLDKSNFSSMLENKGLSLDGDQPAVTLADRTHGIANTPQYVVWMWRELPMPVIAAIDGFCLGGGLQIALGADFRYAKANSKFSILEMRWGIVPDMSSTQIMRHMIRDDVIRELTYTAKIFDAKQAKEWGFITDIVDDPLAHAMSVAKQIAYKNPDAIRAAKKIIDASYYQTAEQGLLMESVEQDKIMGTSNQIEAVMAELQKRKPEFKD